MPYFKVTKEIPGSPWKVGDVQADVPEAVARSFISSGWGEEVKADEWLRAMQATSLEDFGAKLMSQIDEKLAATRSAAGRPTPPGKADFKKVAAGSDPVEEENARAKKRAGLTEALRCLAIAASPQLYHPDMIRHNQRRLNEMAEVAYKYDYDPDTDQLTETRTIERPDGSVEVVTRTGTDSLSGGATYGFALKPEYLENLFEISVEQKVFADKATRIPVGQGNEVLWPAWDQYQPPAVVNGIQQSAVFAGISLGYVGETAPRPSSDGLLNMIQFKIVDLTGYTTLSRDFVVDNYLAMDSAITRMFGRAVGWMEDYMAIQGSGMGKPQGYMNSGATLVVNRSNANKIASDDLTSMIASVSPMVWDSLCWITNITAFPQLSILENAAGTPIFQPNALISQAMKLSAMDKSMGGRGAELMHRPMGDLLGFPLYFCEKVPVLGSTGDLSLVAPSQFGIAERSGLEVALSEHFLFNVDEIAYRFKKRHDMKSLWRAPYQQADGSKTKVAPFVILH